MCSVVSFGYASPYVIWTFEMMLGLISSTGDLSLLIPVHFICSFYCLPPLALLCCHFVFVRFNYMYVRHQTITYLDQCQLFILRLISTIVFIDVVGVELCCCGCCCYCYYFHTADSDNDNRNGNVNDSNDNHSVQHHLLGHFYQNTIYKYNRNETKICIDRCGVWCGVLYKTKSEIGNCCLHFILAY